MMYLKIVVFIIFFIAFILIVMNVVESIIRTKNNERIVWKMDKLTKKHPYKNSEIDKVVTRTGGLAHDRIYDTVLDEDLIMYDMEDVNKKK